MLHASIESEILAGLLYRGAGTIVIVGVLEAETMDLVVITTSSRGVLPHVQHP